jgi:CubicO group peptidase (beta-lactamase class C family)
MEYHLSTWKNYAKILARPALRHTSVVEGTRLYVDSCICSTIIEDLAKWDAALHDGKLLKRTSLDMMWTPARLNNGYDALVFGSAYGFGWMLGDHRGYRIAEHGGASGTHILRFLDDGLTVVVLTNLDVALIIG